MDGWRRQRKHAECELRGNYCRRAPGLRKTRTRRRAPGDARLQGVNLPCRGAEQVLGSAGLTDFSLVVFLVQQMLLTVFGLANCTAISFIFFIQIASCIIKYNREILNLYYFK
jgi:hypothetical protein